MDWRCDSSDRVPALKEGGEEEGSSLHYKKMYDKDSHHSVIGNSKSPRSFLVCLAIVRF
jgi:hypothetical protein